MRPHILLALFVLFGLSSLFGASPKYIFLFIGDGMSTPQRQLAEAFATAGSTTSRTDRTLAMNALAHTVHVHTKSANSSVTDSSAAATAIACGEKTNNGKVGVRPDDSRLESVAEVAKRKGKRVGIVTTVTAVHATPAGFYAHQASRGETYRIGLDLIASGFDYFAASGVYDRYDDRSNASYRGELTSLARKAGYTVNRDDRAGWAALKNGSRSWNIFGDFGMSLAIDAKGTEPTLADFVAKGIEVLDGPQGFFMMCEGGKIDYGCHANDAATAAREILAFDEAVKVACSFAERHPDETLVITTGDHETGGLSLRPSGSGKVALLRQQKISVEQFSQEVKRTIRERHGKVTLDDLLPRVKELFGLEGLRADERQQLEKALAKDVDLIRRKTKDTTAHDVRRRYVFAQSVKNVLNARAGVIWSTSAHTALPAMTTFQGCGAETLTDMTENSDIGLRLKRLLDPVGR